jgi:hypothetical protein
VIDGPVFWGASVDFVEGTQTWHHGLIAKWWSEFNDEFRLHEVPTFSVTSNVTASRHSTLRAGQADCFSRISGRGSTSTVATSRRT